MVNLQLDEYPWKSDFSDNTKLKLKLFVKIAKI